jgi:hemerythrin
MSRYNYPDILQHKILHSNFTKKVDEFENEVKIGKTFISQEVLMFLKSWLLDHIKGTDKSYSPFLNKAGLK